MGQQLVDQAAQLIKLGICVEYQSGEVLIAYRAGNTFEYELKLSQLSTLLWTALQAEKNRLGSPLAPIHKLLAHQRELPPSQGLFVLSVDG